MKEQGKISWTILEVLPLLACLRRWEADLSENPGLKYVETVSLGWDARQRADLTTGKSLRLWLICEACRTWVSQKARALLLARLILTKALQNSFSVLLSRAFPCGTAVILKLEISRVQPRYVVHLLQICVSITRDLECLSLGQTTYTCVYLPSTCVEEHKDRRERFFLASAGVSLSSTSSFHLVLFAEEIVLGQLLFKQGLFRVEQ